jgi:HK97 gp10 family phage protein
MIKAEFLGKKAFENNVNLVNAKIQRAIQKQLLIGANKVHSSAVKSIQAPGSGITYTRETKDGFTTIYAGDTRIISFAGGGNLSPKHRASKSGEAPATDTGNLASSIHVERSAINNTQIVYDVICDAEYAKWLEFGTSKSYRGKGRPPGKGIAPRPFMGPAFDKNKGAIITALMNAIRKAPIEASS